MWTKKRNQSREIWKWAVPVGSGLNEGLGRMERLTPRWFCTSAGFGEEGRWATLEPRDTDGRTGSPIRVPLVGTTELKRPKARAKKGRCPVVGARSMNAAGHDAEEPTFDYQCAARRGFEVATATEGEHRLLAGWPNGRN